MLGDCQGGEVKMSTTQEEVLELGVRWASAERSGDTAALDDLAVEDFTLVGPRGFVLDKAQWLERYRSGQLRTSEMWWHDVVVRDYGDVAIAIGIVDQSAAYNGHPAEGRFRATHIALRQNGSLRLAGIHLGPMADAT
jgi:ketosteroid isomerase-like protein